MSFNQNVGYGAAQLAGARFTTGKVFVVASTSDSNAAVMAQIYDVDPDGVVRLYSTPSEALSFCVAGRGDVLVISPGYTTALTGAELLAAETKGVVVYTPAANTDGTVTTRRATGALPQTTASALFTVTGRIRLLDIIGEVTTIFQTQTNNTKLIANPTVGADVDMCAVLNTTAAAVGTTFTITGTLATAMQQNANGVLVAQAAPLIIPAGTIDLSCSASSTGAAKWMVRYVPLDPGARVIAA